MPETALTQGPDRSQNILDVLNLLKKSLARELKRLKKKDYILIKPNLITAKQTLATTHIDAVITLLDYLRKNYQGKIIIAEGTSIGSTSEAFQNYKYNYLAEKYNLDLIDLNRNDGQTVEAYDRNLKPIKVMIAKTITQAAFRISITPIKTHNTVIASLGIENMVTGSLLKGGIKPVNTAYRMLFRHHFKDYKSAINQSYAAHNLSIASIFPHVKPHLTILDGFQAMQRNGPVGGQPIDMQIALAGLDPIAIDALGAYLMGFDPGRIGYLHHLEFNKHEIRVIGKKISECRHRLRPHDSFQDQLRWYTPKGT